MSCRQNKQVRRSTKGGNGNMWADPRSKCLHKMWLSHACDWMLFVCISRASPGWSDAAVTVVTWRGAIDWMCVSPSKIHMFLMPKPQVDGVPQWGLWEDVKSWTWDPHESESCPYNKRLKEVAFLSPLCEDTAVRQRDEPEDRPRHTLILPTPGCWTSSFPKCEEYISFVDKPPSSWWL